MRRATVGSSFVCSAWAKIFAQHPLLVLIDGAVAFGELQQLVQLCCVEQAVVAEDIDGGDCKIQMAAGAARKDSFRMAVRGSLSPKHQAGQLVTPTLGSTMDPSASHGLRGATRWEPTFLSENEKLAI